MTFSASLVMGLEDFLEGVNVLLDWFLSWTKRRQAIWMIIARIYRRMYTALY